MESLLLFLAAAGVCIALSAIAVSGASAAPKLKTVAKTFIASGGSSTLASVAILGREIKCEANTVSGTIASGGLSGALAVTFSGCTSEGVKCKTGTVVGQVETGNDSYTFVLWHNLFKMYGLLVSQPDLAIKCGVLSILTEGSLILQTSLEEGKAVSSFNLKAAMFTSKQEPRVCEEPVAACSGHTFELLAEFVGGSLESAVETATDTVSPEGGVTVTAEG